ncbi:MAG: sensor histidine kinase [Owenweeksia sp.]
MEQLQSVVKESELQYLRSQINPHFLFNNLNNLYAYALEQSPKTPEIILELSGVLRYMLYECQERYVSLSKEVEQLRNFVNLSRMQFEDRGEIRLSVKETGEDYQIAPLILPVFVENACKHSLSSQSDNISISIELSLKDNGELQFVCENTFSPESNTDRLSRGIGLENVQKRLELLYPDAYHLNINTTGNVYRVELYLQLHSTPV